MTADVCQLVRLVVSFGSLLCVATYLHIFLVLVVITYLKALCHEVSLSWGFDMEIVVFNFRSVHNIAFC